MRDDLFAELLDSIEEAGAVKRTERNAAREMRYVGKVLVEVLEDGRTVWRLDDAATSLSKRNTARADPTPSPREIRLALNQTQEGFADLLNVSIDTVQGWDQGRRVPRGPARTLLAIAARNPMALLQVAQDGGQEAWR